MIKKGDRFIDSKNGVIREVTHTHDDYFIMITCPSDDNFPAYSSEWTKEMIESRLKKIDDVNYYYDKIVYVLNAWFDIEYSHTVGVFDSLDKAENLKQKIQNEDMFLQVDINQFIINKEETK